MGRKAWGCAAAGLAAVLWGGAALAAENDTYQATVRGGNRTSTAMPINDWWWPFGRSETRAARTPLEAAKAQQAKPVGNAGTPPLAAEVRPSSPRETSALVHQTMATYARRQEICDRIRQIAEDTGDAALEAQADLMQQRAWMLCQQRMSQLRMPGLLPEKDEDAGAALTAERKSAKPARAEARQAGAPIRSIRGERAVGQEKE